MSLLPRIKSSWAKAACFSGPPLARTLATVLSVAMVACGLPPAAAAQTGSSPEAPLQDEEMLLLPEIPSVFGASKYEQKTTEAPSSVSIVTAAEIKRYGYRTLADILRALRSFYITNDRNYEYVGVRGFSRPGDYNSRILVLLDGHRLNDNIYDSVLPGNGFILDVDLIDHLEVIRGPSSSLYGSNAFFAVVNVISKRGRDLRGPEVSAEAASHDTYEGRLSYGDRLPGFEFLLSATAGESDGPDWHYPEFDDPATGGGDAGGRDWERYSSAFLKAARQDLTLTAAFSRRKKGIPTAPWGVVFDHPDTWTLDASYLLDLRYEHSFGSRWEVLARGFYDYYRYDGDYPYDWADPGEPPRILIGRDEARGEWWGAEVLARLKAGARHRLVVGTEFRDNLRQDQDYFDDKSDPASSVLCDHRASDYWALFLQEEYRISETLLVNAGVRHDHYSTFGGTTNPRVALIYAPQPETTLKLLYGEAFRAPNAYELNYQDGGVATKANPDLEPETIRTYEAVLEQRLGKGVRAVATGFYYEIDDLINQVEDSDGLLVYRNLDRVEARGAELELEGRRENGLEGRVSYTFQAVKDQETGKLLSNAPKHLAKLNLLVPLYREKLLLGIEEQYTSKRKTVSREETGGYAVTNLTLFCRKLLKGLDASASVYNLFDKKFSDPASAAHLQQTIAQDGRVFRFKLIYDF